jgi:hypothetical protein
MRRSIFVLGATLLAAIVLPSTGSADWSGLQADQVISFDDGNSAAGVEILYYDWSPLHAFWTEPAPIVPELHYGCSFDLGLTWTSTAADRVISFPDGNAVLPGCSVTNGHQPIWPSAVVWSEFDSAAREIHCGVSTDGGTTWSSEPMDRVLSNPASTADAGRPSITADFSNGFHVVWSEMSPAGTPEIHYGRSTDNGLTWSSAAADRVISFPDGRAALDPQIAFCEDELFVVWREPDDAGQMRIHVGMSADLGTTWSSESADRAISPAAIDIAGLDLSAIPYSDYDGVYVAYGAAQNASDPGHYEIYATGSHDRGATWSGESALVPLSHDEGLALSASHPAILVRSFMGVAAVWDEIDEAHGTSEEHLSWGGGTDWSGSSVDSIISFPDGNDGCCPAVIGNDWITCPRGRPWLPICWVAWTESVGSDPDHAEVHMSALIDESGGGIAEGDAPIGSAMRCVPNPSRGAVRIELVTRRTGMATVELVDTGGRLVRSFGNRLIPAGSLTLNWDGRDSRGRPIDPGRYLLRVRQSGGTTTSWIARF